MGDVAARDIIDSAVKVIKWQCIKVGCDFDAKNARATSHDIAQQLQVSHQELARIFGNVEIVKATLALAGGVESALVALAIGSPIFHVDVQGVAGHDTAAQPGVAGMVPSSGAETPRLPGGRAGAPIVPSMPTLLPSPQVYDCNTTRPPR